MKHGHALWAAAALLGCSLGAAAQVPGAAEATAAASAPASASAAATAGAASPAPALAASAAAGAVTAASSPAAAAPAPLRSVLLRPAQAAELPWRGLLPTEGGAVGMGPQIGPYPAAGAAGLLGAILGHALVNSAVRSAEERKAQAEADRVLEAYRPVLSAWQSSQLWQSLQAPTAEGLHLVPADIGQGAVDTQAVQIAPSFLMSQDERLFIADVVVRVETPGAAPAERLVRVIATPPPTPEPRQHWLADEARPLKQAATAMVAHAVAVSLRHPQAVGADVPMRTHRYRRGQSQGVERGQLVHSDCARVVMQTLRGHLLSAPRAETEADTACTRPTLF